ncbi:MAG: hypothetical protein M3209_12475 [Acidobacteriota bacterium]|nr:hypothetical protein [Acidobacteriota bacterium]
MEATSTETTRFCPMCAAPMRPRAVFCHRCGKPYPEESAVVFKANNFSGSVPTTEEFEEKWDTLTNNNNDLQTAHLEKPLPVLPETEIEENVVAEKTTDQPEGEGEKEKTEKKQRVRRRVVQTTEYVWENPSSDPTWRFALATALVLLFAFLVLWFGGFIRF